MEENLFNFQYRLAIVERERLGFQKVEPLVRKEVARGKTHFPEFFIYARMVISKVRSGPTQEDRFVTLAWLEDFV